MGYFKKINLNNFRNFENIEINFQKNFNVIYGDNGSGKTNILESISLFGKGRGIRNDSLINMTKTGNTNFINKSIFNLNAIDYEINVFSTITNNKHKKNLSLNEEVSRDVNEFFYSNFSTLYFLPDMERLFLSTPQFRRNFIDKLIFSYNKNYNKIINNYKKNLLERSNILNNERIDEAWISKIEENISDLGLEIYESRNKQLQNIIEFMNNLNDLNKYKFEIKVELKDSFFNKNLNIDQYKNILKLNRNYDKLVGGSKYGPHKSDFIFYVNNNFLASQLSTGQQKTLILLILICQCNFLINQKNIRPILLFDEVCSHLDEKNRAILLELSNQFDVQIFLTGTDKSLFSFLSTNTKFCNIY